MTGKNSRLERNLAFKKIWAIRKFGLYENLGYRKNLRCKDLRGKI